MSNLPKHSEAMRIRVTAADREVITARATRAGLTVSEYIRRAALGTLTTPPERVPQIRASEYVDNEPIGELPYGRGNAALNRYLSSAGGDDPA